ncbi:MAG TPA: hypothetical protein VIJ12_04375 [Candidatus Baltobacteraceae bacterium]
MPDDLVLMTDVAARRALRGRRLRVTVLAPLGGWLGRGRLRVLRASGDARDANESVHLMLGYESYEKFGT